jgi:tRNA pseudouridine38-40 synthase
MKKLYRMYIVYNGHAYHGWCKQPNVPTIQEVIETGLKKIFQETKFRVLVASRTDTKVHARDQVALIRTYKNFKPEHILSEIQQYLPRDIQVTNVNVAPKGFDLISGNEWKEYIYYFTIDDTDPSEEERYSNFIDKLDLNLMKEAAPEFVGHHDFTNFQYRSGTKSKTMIREIFLCEVIENVTIPELDGDHPYMYALRIKGKGFLRHMVRIIMGSLINIGKEDFSKEELRLALTGPEYPRVGFITQGNGLHLNKIQY